MNLRIHNIILVVVNFIIDSKFVVVDFTNFVINFICHFLFIVVGSIVQDNYEKLPRSLFKTKVITIILKF